MRQPKEWIDTRRLDETLLVYLEYWITRILPPLFDNIWEIWDCSYTGYKHTVIIHNTFKSEANKK